MISKEEFAVLMAGVDRRIRKKGVAIPARPFHAVPLVAEELGVTEEIPIDRRDTDGEITAQSLFSHIHRWCEDHYGDRLKTRVGPGAIAQKIRGEAWKANLPLVYGSVELVADRNLATNALSSGLQVAGPGRRPTHNVLASIEGLPRQLAALLTDRELREIFVDYVFALGVLQEIQGKRKNDALIAAAFTDLDVAVEKLTSDSPGYGLSRWSSLQFTEKVIKAELRAASVEFPNNHNLGNLARIAADHKLFCLDKQLLAEIQCSASVRYGEEPTSLNEALSAHRSSIRAVAPLTGCGRME